MTAPSIAVQLVADRLSIATGMDSRSIDAARLAWTIEARRSRLSLLDEIAYTAYLQTNAEELDALIEEIVVQETRFFRDPAVFSHLRTLLPKLAAEFQGPLRLLSAPCGTGQEPYSLAATIHELGLPLDRFTIDAIDISPAALHTAKKGVYSEQAFRHLSPELARSLARQEKGVSRIHEELRHIIRFSRRNLAEPDALREQTYHLILCRNLFIYLHHDARSALAHSLSSALIPGGRLILGSADRVEELSKFFTPLRPAASFAFALREQAASTTEPAKATKPLTQKRSSSSPRKKASRGRTTHAAGHPSPAAQQEARLNTASELYQSALQYQQTGNLRGAERRCRQALYLAPTHLPALELLQCLWSHHPNQRLRHALTARILRTRAMQTAESVVGKTL